MKDDKVAFPVFSSSINPYTQSSLECEDPGMTLRDWFAGQALADIRIQSVEPERIAKWCFAVADAMLKVRENKTA